MEFPQSDPSPALKGTNPVLQEATMVCEDALVKATVNRAAAYGPTQSIATRMPSGSRIEASQIQAGPDWVQPQEPNS